MLLSSFTVLNMLIGVLCDVVQRVSIEESEKQLVMDTQRRLLGVYLLSDEDNSGTLSHEEFEVLKTRNFL